jgi:hypothetical protein
MVVPRTAVVPRADAALSHIIKARKKPEPLLRARFSRSEGTLSSFGEDGNLRGGWVNKFHYNKRYST